MRGIWRRIKKVGTIGAWLFVIAHIFIWGGAVAYVSHVAGYNLPLLDHDHGCDCAAVDHTNDPEHTSRTTLEQIRAHLDGNPGKE